MPLAQPKINRTKLCEMPSGSPENGSRRGVLLAGLDAGSTTVKLVILDESGTAVYRRYQRHGSRVRETALSFLEDARAAADGRPVRLSVTGSAGLGLSESCGIPFVQEVFATAHAAETRLPGADVVIELGGEDAKIVFLTGGQDLRMNGVCAGGTGAFIDQMASLLGVTPDELDALAARYKRIYPIASRCGVFAKSDIQPLLNQGATKEDLAQSIYRAVVQQTVTGLAQGRRIAGKVAFLGGPLSFSPALLQAFADALKLTPEQTLAPPDARFFVAIGAALLSGGTEARTVDAWERALSESAAAPVVRHLEPLFAGESEYADFASRHARADVPRADLSAYAGDAYLGIDSGSTTTKLVLIAGDGRILYDYYGRNQGSPIAVVREQLTVLRALCGTRVRIVASAVTGYGEDLMRAAFRVDYGIVETMAHYRAARVFSPDVDFILDIGGQDMKCFHLKDGSVDAVTLNEACSSGCGSFIETFADALGLPVGDFARAGVMAARPVDLGTRCTVFMNSSVKQAQRDGAGLDDISAGLAYSVVRNAVYKVIRKRPSELGRHIVVQGGTFLNDAVLRAFEREIGREVRRPAVAGLMGAFGAALYAQARRGEDRRASALLSAEELRAFAYTTRDARCQACANACPLSVLRFSDGGSYVSGNRCDRAVRKGGGAEIPNLYRYKYQKLRALETPPGPRGRIGIPLVLNFFETLPFWKAFFETLGFGVTLSADSSHDLYVSGQHTIPSDTVCYPAKLAHGHVADLVARGVETVFYPCMSYNFQEHGDADNHYNCPVVAYYPDLLLANMPELGSVRFLNPYLGPHNPKHFVKAASAYFEKELGVPAGEVPRAARRAYEAYDAHREDIRREGARSVAYARANGLRCVALAGRPYHVDPEINHGIDRLLSSYGIVVLSEDAIAHLAEGGRRRAILNQWMYHNRLYRAAEYAGGQPDFEVIQMVSFGCGLDAITTDEVRDILRRRGKIYTQIKIDEIDNLGASKIRIRSLLAAVEERERTAAEGAAAPRSGIQI